MPHAGIGQFPAVRKHIEQVIKALLSAFAGLRRKALALVVVLHRLFQPRGTYLVFLLIDGVRLGYIGLKGRHFFGDGLSVSLWNQHAFLKVCGLGIPPGGVNENLGHLPLAEIPPVRYADMQRNAFAFRCLLPYFITLPCVPPGAH